MDSTNNRIVYIQGFLQAYGLDKEALIFPQPPDKEYTHGKNPAVMAPPAPDFLNSQARNKMFTKGFNLNFNNPAVQKLTTKFAPNNAKFLAQPFTGPKTWKQKQLVKHYPTIKKLKNIPGSGKFFDSALGQRVTKALYGGSPEARKDIQAEVSTKAKAAVAPYVKGALGAALGTAAVGIPLMMMAGGSRQQAAPDPRLVELQRHAAAMQPGAVYRLGGVSNPAAGTGLAAMVGSMFNRGGNSGGYSSGRNG